MASPALCSQVANIWQQSFSRLNRNQPGISGLLSFSEAWILASDFLRPKNITDEKDKRVHNMQEVKTALDILSQCKMLSTLLENFLDEIQRQLHLITRDVERHMSEYESVPDPEHIARLIARLAEWHRAWSPIPELGSTILTAYKLAFQTHVFSVLPPSFSKGFKSLVATTFFSSPPEWMKSTFSSPPGSTSRNPLTAGRVDADLWATCDELGMIDRYDSLISGLCYEHITQHIQETCEAVWDLPMLKQCRDWMTDKIVPWMVMPYARNAKDRDEVRSQLQGIGSRLDFHVCKTLADLRTSEIFDIIVDFPDSRKALEDLKECLERVDQRTQLVQALRKANRKRLLHPGADTKLIITQYVSIIRCLRIVDPPGVLLFKVADPIRRYLRDRPDTIRCIVASLVGDGESGESLVDENEPIQPLQQAQVDDYSDPNWEPEPIDAGPDFRTNKPSDIISTLVSIYDSRELFVKELQVLLAQRLLAIKDGNFERERRNIEILKIRFGEAALQVCEVMLKDMTDSRRTDQHVQTQKASVLHPTIISRHFWPSLQVATFNMPGQLKQLQDEYAKEFSLFKPDKKLTFMRHLGTVNLEIELDDRTVTADVPPLEAAFIELFSQKDVWTVAELIAFTGRIERSAAIKALGTWVELGVLKEYETDQYRLLNTAEEISEGVHAPRTTAAAVEEMPAVSTVQQQQAEQMKVFWKFIEGMLKNLGQLPLDRIQQFLKIAPGYDRNIEQLGAFMEAARREGLVTVKDGMWRLNQ